MRQHAAVNIHTYSYVTINHDTAHISPKIFTSHHFTALHYTSLPIFNFPPLLYVLSPRFKNPSLLLTYNYFPNPVSKNM